MKKIEYQDIDIFHNYIKKCDYDHNFNFTYFMLWDERYDFYYEKFENYLLVWSESYQSFFNPISAKKYFPETLIEINNFFEDSSKDFKIQNALPEFSKFIEKLNLNYEVTENRNAYDYIYDAQKVISFSGKKLQKKRNHINHFLKHYENFEIIDLREIKSQELLNFLDAWSKEKEMDQYLEQELTSIKKIFNNLTLLTSQGIAIKIDGKVEAFALGSCIDKERFLLHLEKANHHINGLYPFVRQQITKFHFNDYLYLNAEEDIGDEGLRKSKLSYQPLYLLEKKMITKKA